MSGDALQALLPTIWSLLNSAARPSTGSETESRHLGEQVLASVVTHAIQCSSSGNVKPLATAFVGQVLLVSPYFAFFNSSSTFFRVIDPI